MRRFLLSGRSLGSSRLSEREREQEASELEFADQHSLHFAPGKDHIFARDSSPGKSVIYSLLVLRFALTG